MTGADEAVELLGRLDAAGIWWVLEGGWGVDALLGEQTREHDDVDLGVRAEDVNAICAAFPRFERDDAEWPASFVLCDAAGRKLDCHPLAFDGAGNGLQSRVDGGEPYCWPREHLDARGWIGGREVHCITPELQLRWHASYEVDDLDWHDMQHLCELFGLAVREHLSSPPGFLSDKRPRIR